MSPQRVLGVKTTEIGGEGGRGGHDIFFAHQICPRDQKSK